MIPATPQKIVERTLDRACELYSVAALSELTADRVVKLQETLHSMLDDSIRRALTKIEMKVKINESIMNPKIAK